MSNDLAISVDSVGKAYRLWDNPSARLTAPLMEAVSEFIPRQSRLKKDLRAKARGLYQDFWALKDISFEVRRGQSLAIIGRNGSGKSTLLQIIAGTLQPTNGTVTVKGRIAALLELGSGFNPEFTGRENIYLNATLFGLTRSEIDARFERIASFADIGEFIEQPVKIYSSGMVVRLAFAVAAHIDPEILIVDEALSVGDARFQLKCARAIDRFLEQGVTLLFVSHDTSMIKRLCQHAVLLERGEVVYAGKPNDVVNLYSKLIAEGGSVAALASDLKALKSSESSGTSEGGNAPAKSTLSSAAETQKVADAASEIATLQLQLKAAQALLLSHPDSAQMHTQMDEMLKSERLHLQVSGAEFAYGGELGQIQSVAVIDSSNQPRTWFTTCEPIVVRMRVIAAEDFHEPIFALTLKNMAGVEIYGTNTLFSRQPSLPLKNGEQRDVEFAFDLNVMAGHYFISVGFTHFVGDKLAVIHRRYDTIKIEVLGIDGVFGIANLKAKISAKTPVAESVV